MKTNNLVSVIIPVFNGERFLKQAIESVLIQSYPNVEIIVLDDGSTDLTKEIATSFSKVVYSYQENQGVAAARNKALELANGYYIAYLDSDDFMPHNKLAFQIDYLMNNPTIGFCIGMINNFVEPGYEISDSDLDYFMNHEKLGLPTMVTYKHLYDEVGLYNINYKTGSDFEWVARANDKGVKFSILNDVLLNRRIHSTNLTLGARKSKKVMLYDILRESMIRKRNQ